MSKWFLVLGFCYFLTKNVNAQNLSNDSLLLSSFSEYKYKKASPRSFMSFKNRSLWYKVNPISYASIGLMLVYQRFLSQQLGAQCAYEISCSEHAKKAIERYGILKGLMFGFYQLQSCTPKTGYDFQDHAINKEGEIINPIQIDED